MIHLFFGNTLYIHICSYIGRNGDPQSKPPPPPYTQAHTQKIFLDTRLHIGRSLKGKQPRLEGKKNFALRQLCIMHKCSVHAACTGRYGNFKRPSQEHAKITWQAQLSHRSRYRPSLVKSGSVNRKSQGEKQFLPSLIYKAPHTCHAFLSSQRSRDLKANRYACARAVQGTELPLKTIAVCVSFARQQGSFCWSKLADGAVGKLVTTFAGTELLFQGVSRALMHAYVSTPTENFPPLLQFLVTVF